MNTTTYFKVGRCPDGTPQLLGLVQNYCVKPPLTKEMTKRTFSLFKKDVHQIYDLRDAEGSGDYISKLYLNSKYAFKDVLWDIKESLLNFIQAIKKSSTN